jgi:hypothetical protein
MKPSKTDRLWRKPCNADVKHQLEEALCFVTYGDNIIADPIMDSQTNAQSSETKGALSALKKRQENQRHAHGYDKRLLRKLELEIMITAKVEQALRCLKC